VLAGVGLFIYLKASKDNNTGVVITPLGEFKTTDLHIAARDGDLAEVKRRVLDGADIEAKGEHGMSVLMEAVSSDHVIVARWLLSEGALLRYEYQREETAQERKRIARLYRRTMGDTLAAQEEMFKDLPEDLKAELLSDELQSQMNNDMLDLHFSKQIESAISYCYSMEMLKMLVEEFGADVNEVDEEGYWPLSRFAESNDLATVKWLLENGADPNQTSTGETAIYKAIREDNGEMVQLFLDHGASLIVEDVDGWNPMSMCKSVEIARLLIDNGVDLLVRDQGDFPCWYFINDEETKIYVEAEARERGYK